MCALLAGLETAGIYLLKLARQREQEWAVTFVGVVSAVLINVGLVPQFYEIYKLRDVVGVSYTFLAIDTAGAVFSFASLFFDNGGSINVLAAVSYGLLILEEGLIFLIGGVLKLRSLRRRRRSETVKVEESESY